MAEQAYQVIARRWRPRQFDEIVGQEHIVRTLKNAIETDRIAHAYLFVGPRGTGKTTTARIFAKALNAEGGPNVAPDNDSALAQSIMNGSCMDVIEIDGASNNGVDHIRDLREECQYSPAQGQFKIYIIDEVHMLSNQAWNALLKTLEEPPAHVKFIFATTEAHKVLATVVSRCQRFEFRPIPDERIIERLEHIAKTDGIDVDAGALRAIARMADGGMRDAQSILDQLISFCGHTITEPDVLDVYGLAAPAQIDRIAQCLAGADYQGLFDAIEAIAAEGRDLYRVLLDIQARTREALVAAIRSGGETDTLGTPLTAEALTRMVDALQSGEHLVRTGLSQRVNFEVALLRAIDQSRVRAIDTVIKQLSQLAAGLPQEAGQKKIETTPPPGRIRVAPLSAPPRPIKVKALEGTTPGTAQGPIAVATGLTTDSPAQSPGPHPDGPTEDEWNRAASQAEDAGSDSDEVITSVKRPPKQPQRFGPGTPEFQAARNAIPADTQQLLEELLRAEFKFAEKLENEWASADDELA